MSTTSTSKPLPTAPVGPPWPPGAGRAALASAGVDHEDVLGRIAAAVDGASAVLLVGSMAESMATPDSDIDILVVRPDATADVAGASPYTESVSADRHGREINVVSWDRSAVDELGDRFVRGLAHVLEEPGASPQRFTEPERRMLHRLATGIPLGPPAPAIEEIRATYRLTELPALLFSYHLVGYNAYIRKAASKGAVAGDATALKMLQTAVERLIGAMLASVGDSHPTADMRLWLLRRHEQELGASIVERAIALSFPTLERPSADQVAAVVGLAEAALADAAGRDPAFARTVARSAGDVHPTRLGVAVQGRG